MSLLQMSMRGSVIILAVIMIRALLLDKLPKKTFLFLWGIALFRLTVPFSVSSELSVYSLLQRNPGIAKVMDERVYDGQEVSGRQDDSGRMDASQAEDMPDAEGITESMPDAEGTSDREAASDRNTSDRPILEGTALGRSDLKWMTIWLIGFLVCAGYFILSYLKWRREFRFSTAVTHEEAARWLAAHSMKRRIEIRQSGRISAPLTYGLIVPVILMPETTKWEEGRELPYVLEHEFVHIRRLDGATKFVLIVGLCIHWFNPLVWAMYVLANRDLELSCDETVVRRFGEDSRACYTRTLIHMEEKKSALIPLSNNFSRNAIEERIKAIMKIKKTSLITILAAVALILCVTIFFATSAVTVPEPEESGRQNESEAELPNENKSRPQENDSLVQETFREEGEEAQKITLQVSAGIAMSAQEEGTFFYGDEKSKFFWYTITNDTDKTITGIEYGMLAYDSQGNPLKIYWNPLDSSKVSSYSCTVKDSGVLLGPGEAAEHERTIFDVDSSWSFIELREGEAYRVDMVLYCIRQTEFEDGTVWENPEYEDWIQNCEGKKIPSSYLWDYYPCEYLID